MFALAKQLSYTICLKTEFEVADFKPNSKGDIFTSCSAARDFSSRR